jgi:hypothetical protein
MTGIYFLIKDSRIVYIGQSTNIEKRVISHKYDKDFDSYRTILCDSQMLLHYEKRLIKYFKPILNGEPGGKREGAGRPVGSFTTHGEPSKPMRIPLSLVDEVKKLISKKRSKLNFRRNETRL